MSWFKNALSSSIGRKFIMAVTGLFLVFFLIGHLAGNFLLFKDDGGQAFNEYAHFMTSNAFIQVLRILTFAAIIFHLVYSIVLTAQNNKARPIGYAVRKPSPGTSWMSRNMGILGFIVLVFLLIHLRTFLYTMSFGDVPYVEYDGVQVKNLHAIVVEAFTKLWYTGLYVLFMLGLAFHLAHGFQSSFQSLGARHPKYTPAIRVTGMAFSIIVPLLFAIIPVYIYLTY